MTFTYTGDLATDTDKVRFEIGDVDSTDALLTDEEITGLLDEHGTPLAAAAAACDALAARFSRQVDFTSSSERSFKLSQRAAAYAARAKELRARIGGGVGTVELCPVDPLRVGALTLDNRLAYDDRPWDPDLPA